MITIFDEIDMKREALDRMATLGLGDDVQADFENHNIVSTSSDIFDTPVWASHKEKAIIEAYENEWDHLVYHAIDAPSPTRNRLILLFVSNYKTDWIAEREDLKNRTIMAYVVNLDHEECSKFEFVRVKPMNGKLIQID